MSHFFAEHDPINHNSNSEMTNEDFCDEVFLDLKKKI